MTGTGSLLNRDTTSLAPLEVVDREYFDSAGYSNIIDVARNLTVNSGSVLVQDTGTLVGTSQINMRGLGLGSTLTLVNGRRAGIAPIADAGGNDFFDVNQLPLAMIERIEFLKDGASSTYGSQAVAGVANIITRKGFEGLELSVRHETSTNDASSINLAAGSPMGQRGHFNFYATVYDQERGDRSNYDFIVERLGGVKQGVDPSPASAGPLTSSTGQPGSYTAAIVDPATGEISPYSGATFADPNCEAAGGILAGSRCRHDFFDQVSVVQDQKRYQAFTEFDYDMNDNITVFAESHLSRNRVKRTSGPGLFQNGLVNTGAIFVPGDHPFNFFVNDPADPSGIAYVDPADWDPATDEAVDLVCLCRPLGDNLNGKDNAPPRVLEIDYWRGLAGMSFDLNENWSGEVAYQRSHARRSESVSFNFIADAVNQAALDGTWNPFGSSLATPQLVSPKDSTSVAGNTQSVLDSLYTTEQNTYKSSQSTFDAVLTGNILSDVGLAVGLQYRKEAFSFTPDSLNAAAQSASTNPVNPTSGDQDVFSVFGETIIPVTDQIELQLALRHEDYGDKGGTTTDPKIAVRYNATGTIALRGSYGTSFQAPTVRQFSETSSRQLYDDSAVVNPITGALSCGEGGTSISGELLITGSPELGPQSAKNYNLGVILTPSDEFELILDYWNFEYDDLISQDEGAQAIIDNDCASDGIPNDPRIERDGGGNIRRVSSFFINTSSVKTDGFDFTANYHIDIRSGTLKLSSSASYINSFEYEQVEGEGYVDIVGSRNSRNQFRSLPEIKANVSANYSWGNHSVTSTVRYIDGYTNDANDEAVDSFSTLDLQYAFSVNELIGDKKTYFSIGANNILDEDPPTLGYRDRPGFDDSVHDVRGRIVYVSLTQQF
ncbi:TonB-dependent receptor domain-containing protein [Kineobactrum salinum]|uniref:TonB-dependent receptor n=1 Tax=Kineobactrum salinum TaxID=2708301 RepID=A0A6C0U6Q0_9GAMM|nr:TonB-dependent receptor [Kineobactrum salinum]QIB65124.1 TonB-dependent receptor [Kineobactrum salinum]